VRRRSQTAALQQEEYDRRGRGCQHVERDTDAGTGHVAAALCGWIALASRARALDVACLSEDEAESSGVALQPLRRVLFAVGGLLAAVSVAYAGPIGFVGLIGPHIARRLVGARHAMLVPGSALAGAAVLVSADLLRQLLDLGTGRLPVGVVTALAGGPAFLWLLRRRTGS